MAAAFVKALSEGGFDKATTNQITVTTTGAAAAGNLIVAHIVFDNFTTASKPIVSSLPSAVGETGTWVFLGAARSTSTTLGAFASAEIWAIKTSVAWPAGGYVFQLDASVVSKAVNMYEFSGTQATLRGTAGTAYSTTTTAATATTAGTAPVVGDLAVGLIFQSNSVTIPATDTDVLGGSWVSGAAVLSTGGSVATNNAGRPLHKILTAVNAQTLNSSAALTAGNGVIVAVLQAYVAPAITQASYRFYADGTEAGSVALAAQDTAYAADVTAADLVVMLRARLQITNATGIVDSTDDWQLQYEKNASGTWVNVTTSDTSVAAFNSANMGDASATTNRLGAGTGIFVAGRVSEQGLVANTAWSAPNYTEFLYPLSLKQATLYNGDTLRFRILQNGATTNLTYTQTPTITIIGLPTPTITQAAYRFYADGTEAGSVALAAQDTAYTADVSPGDAIALLRARLQATNLATVATDDWQLQWEKNASGTWTDVNTSVLADTYPESNQSSTLSVGTATIPALGLAQAVLGNGQPLKRLGFKLAKLGAPTTTLTAAVWVHTGTFGSGTPSGSVSSFLASSTPVAASSLTTTSAWVYFDFDGSFTLANGFGYYVGFFTTSSPSDTNNVIAGTDNTSPTHAGNFARLTLSGWDMSSTHELIFEMYTAAPTAAVQGYQSANLTEGGATTNRLGAGTGSFVAGKVSKDGTVDDLSWTANDYTEVLYSLLVKQANLANGDTLRFRIRRNAAAMTYSQTPTMPILKSAPTTTGRPKVWNGSAWVQKPLKVWNGSGWVEKPIKVWTGSAWKTLT